MLSVGIGSGSGRRRRLAVLYDHGAFRVPPLSWKAGSPALCARLILYSRFKLRGTTMVATMAAYPGGLRHLPSNPS